MVFNRSANGTLQKREAVSTGGNGSLQSVGCGPACPILDSQNAVVVSQNGKLVFAVNAGSDTVTSFRETNAGLKLVNQVSSGGDMPESLALHGNLLYVLNVATANANGTSGNIYGLRVRAERPLRRIRARNHSPTRARPDLPLGGRARRSSTSPTPGDRRDRDSASGAGSVPPGPDHTYEVSSNGARDPAVAHRRRRLPFGFAFDNKGT